MKYLLLTLDYPPAIGGVANYYDNLVKYWPPAEKIEVYHPQSFSYFQAILNIFKYKIKYLIVGQILPWGTVALFLKLFFGFKYAVVLHGMDLSLDMRGGRKKTLTKLILSRADKIICANSYVASLIPENKTIVINPGIEIKTINPKVSSVNKTVLFSLGRLVRRKGFDRVIEALRLLPQENLVYYLAGAGEDEKYLKDLAQGDERIIFLGKISEEEKWQYLADCDIFIMTSRDIAGDFEGFGIVYLEANLCGKAVIAGRSGGINDAVIDKETGLLVEPEDLKAIARTIKILIADPELRNKLGAQGRERAIKEFNWQKKVKEFYKSL